MNALAVSFCIGLCMTLGFAIAKLLETYDRDKKDETIRKLERENSEKTARIIKLETDIFEGRKEMMDIVLHDRAPNCPKDCKIGPWCQACTFKKEVLVRAYGDFETVTYCGRETACKNFTQAKYD